MQMLLKDGIRYFAYDYNRDEDELEHMVIEHSEILFGEDSVFFPKQKIRASSGIGTIPDGFVLLIDKEKWYVVEVELSSHPLHQHIVVQMSKFNSAIRNLDDRRRLIRAFYDVLAKNIQMKYKFEVRGISKELYKFLSDIIDKDPGIIVVIDQKTEELDEVCATLPLLTTVLEFKTYCREGVGNAVHIHFVETLKHYEPSVRVVHEEQKQIRPGTLRGGGKTLTAVLDVANLVFNEGKTYNEAVKIVALQREVREQTIMDQCGRSIGVRTADFRKLLEDKEKLKSFLNSKFPDDRDVIATRL